MTKKRKIMCGTLMAFTINSYASFFTISDHSRANCINNESITWDATKAHNLAVVSFHTRDYLNQFGWMETHRLDTGWAFTRRQAAVCWTEGDKVPSRYYLVNGYHWEMINKVPQLRENTLVDDCSIYNGWWEI